MPPTATTTTTTRIAVDLSPTGAAQPQGRPLRNDGVHRHWLISGRTYRLEHDGVGWRVTCQQTADAHIYRLALEDGETMADTLSTDGGRVRLTVGAVYELVEAGGGWELHTL